MEYQGKATIRLNGADHRALVILDPDKGTITAKLPQGIAGRVSDQKLFGKKYMLTNLHIELPAGTIRTSKLTGLILMSSNDGTYSVHDSNLVRSLSLYGKEVGISRLVLIPPRRHLQFHCEDVATLTPSELIFYSKNIGLHLGTVFTLKRSYYKIINQHSLTIVRSKTNLLPKRSAFYYALSILQGGEVMYRSGVFKNTLEISFEKQREHQAYGNIFDNEHADLRTVFLEKFLVYHSSQDKKGKARLEFWLDYLLIGLRQDLPLTSRLISLYTLIDMQINDLNRQLVAQLFSISNGLASVYVKIRNRIIHEGMSAEEAAKPAYKEAKAYEGDFDIPFAPLKLTDFKAALRFYDYLLVLIIEKLFQDIGMPEESQVSYRRYLK